MEFWGVELKGDKPVKVTTGFEEVIHLSQANFAEIKKGSDPVMLYAKVGDKKLVIGVLTGDKFPQLSFDLIFEQEVELSHNWKNGSIHLTGYKSLVPDEGGEVFSDFSDEDEEDVLPIEEKQNGVVAKKDKLPAAAKKENKPEGSDEEDDSDSDEEMGEDDDSDEDESDEEEEETPVKSEGGKKRPAPAAKTPEPKKAKLVTPQKTDGKKGADKSNAKTPNSVSQVSCTSCKKTFNSQNALDSHSKAKHAAK